MKVLLALLAAGYALALPAATYEDAAPAACYYPPSSSSAAEGSTASSGPPTSTVTESGQNPTGGSAGVGGGADGGSSGNGGADGDSGNGGNNSDGGDGGEAPTANLVAFAGFNIAGFDFGCDTNGHCDLGGTFDVASKGTGLEQMQHFVQNDGMNAFRLPVGWQYLVNNNLGGPLDENNAAAYDKLVNGCVSVGAKMCIVDIHNYARYNGQIIGQGGPSNDQYAHLLSQLAARYKDMSQVAFDIMNEPHNLDIGSWAQTSQAAVTAIRQAGANDHMILIPGTDFTSAEAFPTASGPALLGVKNPDGTTDNLLFNVHQYLDSDGSGTHSNCVRNNINDAFNPLADFLRKHNRTAMLTETGGGPTDSSCMSMLCEQNDYINKNSDVFKGVIHWSAGGFSTNYVLSTTPNIKGGMDFTDQPLVTQCVVSKFKGVNGVV